MAIVLSGKLDQDIAMPRKALVVGEEVRKMELFVLGIAVGIAVHRLIMAFVLWCRPDSRCAYCVWLGKNKNRRK